jgi:hypothetical protein
VSGNPGTTNRLFTKAQLEFERDIRIPMKLEQLTNRWRFKTDWPGFDPENPSRSWASARVAFLQLENGLKAARGKLNGLEDAKLMAQKTAAEKAFKDCVMADEKLAEKYGDLWDRIASVVKQRRLHEPRARFHTPDAAPLLGVAVAIVRSCDPAETEEHRERARKTVESWAGAPHSPNGGWIGSCVDHVVRARTWLSEDDPYFSKVLGGKSAEGWPSRLPEYLDAMEGEQARRSSSWLGYPEPRKTLVKSGWKAIQKSDDPVIVAARELVTLMRKHEKLGDELDAKEEALTARRSVPMGR